MDISTHPSPVAAWLPAFEALVAAAMRRPFEWGVHDCCTFAAACWQARTGQAVLGALQWQSEAEAQALLAELGGLRAAVAGLLGEPGPALLCAQGDVVLAVDPNNPAGAELLCVCLGPHLVAPGARGLMVLQLADGLCCWKAQG